MSLFYSCRSDGILLQVRVQPGSSKNSFEGLFAGNALKIKLRARPIDGEANAALVKFLAKCFSLRASDVQLIKGEKSRSKQLFLPISESLFLERLRTFVSL